MNAWNKCSDSGVGNGIGGSDIASISTQSESPWTDNDTAFEFGGDFEDVSLDAVARKRLQRLSGDQRREVAQKMRISKPRNPSAFVMHWASVLTNVLPLHHEHAARNPGSTGASCHAGPSHHAGSTVRADTAADDVSPMEYHSPWCRYQDPNGKFWWCDESCTPPVHFFYEGDPEWCKYLDSAGRCWWSHELTGRWFYEEPRSGACAAPGALHLNCKGQHNTDAAMKKWRHEQSRWPEMMLLIAQRGDFQVDELSPEKLREEVTEAVPREELIFLVRCLTSPSGAGLIRQWGSMLGELGLVRDERPALEQLPKDLLLRFVCAALVVEPARFELLWSDRQWYPFQKTVLKIASDRASNRCDAMPMLSTVVHGEVTTASRAKPEPSHLTPHPATVGPVVQETPERFDRLLEQLNELAAEWDELEAQRRRLAEQEDCLRKRYRAAISDFSEARIMSLVV